jgi:hypothetical protein
MLLLFAGSAIGGSAPLAKLKPVGAVECRDICGGDCDAELFPVVWTLSRCDACRRGTAKMLLARPAGVFTRLLSSVEW